MHTNVVPVGVHKWQKESPFKVPLKSIATTTPDLPNVFQVGTSNLFCPKARFEDGGATHVTIRVACSELDLAAPQPRPPVSSNCSKNSQYIATSCTPDNQRY